jgi:hypothetical protein
LGIEAASYGDSYLGIAKLHVVVEGAMAERAVVVGLL